ncbi:MAG TPA: glucuronyl hydrolase [Bacteroidales bacterium]|nr:glucuronyl hydrolase [Bacteroidales bacterium]
MKIYKPFLLMMATGMALVSCSNLTKNEKDLDAFIDNQLHFAVEQYRGMEASLPDTVMPRTLDKDGNLVTSGIGWWTSGFYPGTLWYLYEYSGDEKLRDYATRRTMLVEPQKNNTGTHDLGFMLYCSFGNAYRITEEPRYKDILVTGARSLSTRYNPVVGCIRSWDHGDWEFPVIIDNMMNLEYLYWAAQATGDDGFYNIAVTHSNTTMKNHFRPDYSSWHLVDYDTITGQPIAKETVQGYSDSSAWARGQSWGLYGYTVGYRETHDTAYRDLAVNIANFLLNNPNMPEDMVPYWDFNAPDIPDAYRDASAGAIMASALIELSAYTNPADSARFMDSAIKTLHSLGSAKYRAKAVGDNGHFILEHSVGSIPHNSEVDVPLTYADYYFVEALLRLKERLEGSDYSGLL